MANSDEHLVVAARAGDGRAFEEIVRRYYGLILRRAGKILGNREDAEEVAQETFLKAHRSLEQIRDGRSVRSWLGRIGVRLALNRAERDRFRRMLSLDRIVSDHEIHQPPEVDQRTFEGEDVERSRRARLVRREITRLSPAQKSAFMLRHVEQLSFREVAESMGNSESTARVLYFQAIRRLRRALEERR
jgi:RNA polymerase sigma-70 factor (ECF subfamily)